MSPTHRSHGVSSSSPTAFSTACSQTWYFYLCAYTAKDVPEQGRETGEGSGVWLWEMSMWQLRPQGLRLLVGRGSSGWRSLPPLPCCSSSGWKAEPHSDEAKDSRLRAGGRAQFPRPLGHIALSPPGREMLLFQKAFVTSLEWGIWDNSLG